MDRVKIHQDLNNEVLSCKKCDLSKDGCIDNLKPYVMGQGNLNSKIMFIAENPGTNEVINKQPLTSSGVSGKVYENILKYIGLEREDVYTTNVVLCHSPKNRDPELYEVKKCQPYLERQIRLIEPELIVTFGRFAAQAFIDNFKITKDHGSIVKSEKYGIDIFPVYHPVYYKAYASIKRRAEFKVDINKLKKIVENFRKIA